MNFIVYFLVAVTLIYHVIAILDLVKNKRLTNQDANISYFFVFTMPFLGPLLYFFYIKSKYRRKL